MLSFIHWNIDPEIFHLGPLSIRYYGLFFALSFLLGYHLLERMFKAEKIPLPWLEKLFMYVMVATIVGARLGHVFFYGWEYYSQNLGDILKVWEGGLASHGGAIGIIIAIILFSKKVSKKSPVWILDRLLIAVALAACFIRLGNLMNSEIIGVVTNKSWAFIFERAHTDHPELPRHPAQLYESLSYFVLFVVLFYMYWKTEAAKFQGRIMSVFFIVAFTMRFIIEFVKEDQEAFEQGMLLNMGQILSIPFILIGFYYLWRSFQIKSVKK